MVDTINSDQLAARRRLCANLRIYRGKLTLSQEALAARAGLHRTYVSQVERGLVNASLDNLVLLAGALGVQVTDLLQEPREDVPLGKVERKSKNEESR